MAVTKSNREQNELVLNAANSVQDRENAINIVSRWIAMPVAQLMMVKSFIHQQ